MHRLLLSLLSVAMLLPAESGVLVPVGQAGSGRVQQQQWSTQRRSKTRSYINIKLLHQALDGSHLHDDGCLLFRTDECDVVVLANKEGNGKFVYIRVLSEVKKNKRRDVLDKVRQRIGLQLPIPHAPHAIMAEDHSSAILYYDALEKHPDNLMLGQARCEMIHNLLSGYAEDAAAVSVDGLACAVRFESGGVEMELALDLSEPEVNYVELRGGKVRGKGTNPVEVIEGMFLNLNAKPTKDNATLGKGENRLRAMKTDGTYYLCRNAKPKSKFFVAGTPERLKEAVERDVGFKNYGFVEKRFADYSVDWDMPLNTDSLVKKDTPDKKKKETPPADEDADVTTPQPTEPEVDAPQQAEPEPSAEPLTPAAARDAYLKMLREM